MKQFSVVMTTYMLGNHIRKAIDSVCTQTFGDFELIIVDDGSTDNTEEEIARFKDKRIKYIRQPHSGLPAKARNRGLRVASGNLVAFFDGDDLWQHNKLERCLDMFKQNRQIDILCHDLALLRAGDGKVYKRSFFGPYQDNIYEQLLFKGNALTPSSTIIKRSIFSQDEYSFSEEKRLCSVEDYDLWLRLSKSGRYYFFYLPEVLGMHRVLETSISMANIKTNAENMFYLLDRNTQGTPFQKRDFKIAIKRRKSRIMFGAALAFNYRKKFLQSLIWHLKAIKEYPFYWKPYVSFFASLLGIRLNYV